MKKTYISPNTLVVAITPATVITASRLDPAETNPTVIVSNETLTDGFFSSRRGGDLWDDEDE